MFLQFTKNDGLKALEFINNGRTYNGNRPIQRLQSIFFFTPDIHEGEQQKGGRIIYVGTLVLAAYFIH